MSMPPFLLAILALWGGWGLSWLAAWRWTGATRVSAGAAAQARYRILNLAGWIALFVGGWAPAPRHGAERQVLLVALWQVPPWLGWALAVLAAAALGFGWSARAALGRLWSADVTRKEGHRLVEHGPYRIVRHPIYTAILGAAAALALAKGTPLALAGLALMVVGYRLKARLEERFLAAELGPAGYAAYAARVPMLLPFGPR